jgi:hypothetical protein
MPQGEKEAAVSGERQSGSRVSVKTGETLVRLTVPVTDTMHNAFAVLCVELDMKISNRLMQLITYDIEVGIGLEPPVKAQNKGETHKKRITANVPKKQLKVFRLFCLRKELELGRDYCMADHAEQLVDWDIKNAGKLLPPIES